MQNIIKYILLGIIQGITEPLPVSSSGHLMLFKHLFKTTIFNDINFEIFLNFASFIAIFIIYFSEIKRLLTAFFTYIFNKDKRKSFYKDFKYCLLILIGVLPVGFMGLFFKDELENMISSTWILGITFIITAILLLLIKDHNGDKDDYDLTYKDALIVGLVQVLTLIPGISRSGTVLFVCLLLKMSRSTALKYTFMLYFPISVGTIILGVRDLIVEGLPLSMMTYYCIGMIFAGLFTYFTYKILSEMVKKGKLWKFSIYLFILGIFTLIYFL